MQAWKDHWGQCVNCLADDYVYCGNRDICGPRDFSNAGNTWCDGQIVESFDLCNKEIFYDNECKESSVHISANNQTIKFTGKVYDLRTKLGLG